MKKRIPGVVLVALVSVGVFAGPAFSAAPATKKVVFSSKYTGKASLLINNGQATISSVTGTGKNSLFGASKVSGSGSAAASQQCDPFGGKGNIASGANKIMFTVTRSSSQQGCSNGESGPVTITFHGVAVATGGIGAAKGASGSLKFKGTLKLGGTSGSQDGSFTVALSGTLTVKA
ncbi:MAG: hypothetical protein ABSC31_13015 [Acidimicrobiales bacterium]|jgi:hypothetical protein